MAATDGQPEHNARRRLQFVDELGQATRSIVEPAQMLEVTSRMLGQHLRAHRCAYAQVEPGGEQVEILGDYTDGVRSIVGRYALALFGQVAVDTVRAGKAYINHDVDEDPRTKGTDLTAYRLTQIQSVVCVPLHKEGRLVALMAVHQAQPRQWTPGEVDLVQEVVARCWESLQRLRGESALREAIQRLNLALSAGELGDWHWEASTDLVRLSARACDIFGLPRDVTMTWTDMRGLLHPEDAEQARLAVEQAVVQRSTYSTEYRVRLQDGSWRWVAAKGKGTYDAKGAVEGMIGIVQDVTRRRLADESLQFAAEERRQLLESERAARRELERAGAVKDEFLATLSHELRTPISAILGWAQILRRMDTPSPEDVRKGMEVIERNARMQAQLIDDLLDVSRFSSGKLRLDVQTVAPLQCVEAAIETVRPAADAAGIAIEATLDPLAGPIAGDPGRLQQIVWNLLANAVKFSPRGGKVRVVLERVNSHVEITVADRGIGIPADFLPHIFERFRQGDGSTTRRYGGLGLGLAIVKHLAEAHGGAVRASSAGPGQGSTFTVHLPLKAVDMPYPSQRIHPERGGPLPSLLGEIHLGGVKVLVVDDEPDARSLLQRVLEECGATVLLAEGAGPALSAIESERPHVLVSDIGMPDVDGYELLRRVRKLGPDRGGAVPAIALTAFARSEDRVRALRAGFAVHVAKPVEPSEIAVTVASLSGRVVAPL